MRWKSGRFHCDGNWNAQVHAGSIDCMRGWGSDGPVNTKALPSSISSRRDERPMGRTNATAHPSTCMQSTKSKRHRRTRTSVRGHPYRSFSLSVFLLVHSRRDHFHPHAKTNDKYPSEIRTMTNTSSQAHENHAHHDNSSHRQ